MEPYKIEFVWNVSGKEGAYDSVKCNGEDISGEATLPSALANGVIQLWKNEMKLACSAANTSHVLSLTPGRFIYLDVGRWSNGIQTFGLISGKTAVLCNYSGSNTVWVPPFPGLDHPNGGDLMAQFLKTPGVTPTKWLSLIGPTRTDLDSIYVILPDMHVAASPPPGIQRPNEHNPFLSDLPISWMFDPAKFDEWSARDLFGSRKSISLMVKFLNSIAAAPIAGKIKLVQVGDMYELWMKRQCKFQMKKPSGPPGVDLKNASDANLVGEWICDTHELFPELFIAFDRCKDKLQSFTVLHGNHDSYLSVPDVVSAANRLIRERSNQPNGKLIPARMATSTVHPRQADLSDAGAFIEHGQRADQFNSDGNPAGHGMTQSGDGVLMMFDTTRRNSFVAAAAAKWYIRSQQNAKDFFYVMGHTHSADLNYIEVTHRTTKKDFSIPPPMFREN